MRFRVRLIIRPLTLGTNVQVFPIVRHSETRVRFLLLPAYRPTAAAEVHFTSGTSMRSMGSFRVVFTSPCSQLLLPSAARISTRSSTSMILIRVMKKIVDLRVEAAMSSQAEFVSPLRRPCRAAPPKSPVSPFALVTSPTPVSPVRGSDDELHAMLDEIGLDPLTGTGPVLRGTAPGQGVAAASNSAPVLSRQASSTGQGGPRLGTAVSSGQQVCAPVRENRTDKPDAEPCWFVRSAPRATVPILACCIGATASVYHPV